MQTDPPGDDPEAWRLARMESSFEEINLRIGRLAIALKVSLKSDDELASVMNRRHQPVDPGSHPNELDVHLAHKWEELRGLLVLRYGIETHYVDQVGIVATRRILIEAETQLMREGFNPGDDGIDLARLLD